MKSSVKILLALLALLACQNLLAALDWYPHPYIEKIKSVSSMKGMLLGTYIITNKFPPKGKLYPGVTLFTNLISRGAVFAAYNRWDGPEVGSDYDLEYNPAKMRYFYSDVDDATVSYKLKNRKFRFSFPEKEWCELDYCLFLDGETYHLYTSPKTAKLSCKSAFAEDISPDIPEGEDMNICLSSMQTNNWFIGDPVYPMTSNGIKYKASLALTNGCKVKFSFDAASQSVSHKIVDPCGHYIQPCYYTALGTRELNVNGQEIKSGDSGEGFMFTNDVLVLNGFHGDSIDFRGGLTIMSVEGTTNTVESAGTALRGEHGLCNFEGWGRVEFRGQPAIECDDCAMVLEEIDTFNATDFEEAIVDQTKFISAPEELRIDGKDARYHKEGQGWRYDRGTLYLDNFHGGYIESDGYIKIELAPNSVNVLTNRLECYYGDLTITGAEGASLATPCIDQSYGHVKMQDLKLIMEATSKASGIDVFDGGIFAGNCDIEIRSNGLSNVFGLVTSGKGVFIKDSRLKLDTPGNDALSTDDELRLENVEMKCNGHVGSGIQALLDGCEIESSWEDFDAFTFAGKGFLTNTVMTAKGGIEAMEDLDIVNCEITAGQDLADASLDVNGSLRASYCTLDLKGEINALKGDFLLCALKAVTSLSNTALNISGDLCASKSAIQSQGCDIAGQALFAGGSLVLTNSILEEAFACTDGLVASNMTIQARGALLCGTNAHFVSSLVEVLSGRLDAIESDGQIFIKDCNVAASSEAGSALAASGDVNILYSLVQADCGTNAFGISTTGRLHVAGSDNHRVTATLESQECVLESGAITGSIECSTFTQLGGTLDASGEIGLEISRSGSFKGGNATIDGTDEAISCPEDIEMADSSKADLSGYKHIEIEKGLLKKAE